MKVDSNQMLNHLFGVFLGKYLIMSEMIMENNEFVADDLIIDEIEITETAMSCAPGDCNPVN
ncbi:hypothetical protein DA099_11200 [Photobacterium damselae]|uniref:Uncharacterized protein n=1 Tax=Photobacterium damselae TaxID=38293 RepID=A0ACD3T2A1_PHODM|nr:hypothetical protein A0J46_08015 [Photobacterium damselae subsp. damselae]RDL29027.1 hypothetical protein BC461_01495 [Photobacterium damselae]TMX49001.1 hypothetical protein DA099_11200 [Photobacterium damselae]TMX70472.1 hypothetical protein DA090_00830 [Photobacterium damselae]TMX78990.1 hypothetical protein DA092_00830 [Photobacterium damselae]